MKTTLQLLFSSCLFFFSAGTSMAASPSGGEITYKSLGNNQYLVRIGVYRDCRGIAFSSNAVTVNWFAGSGGNTSCGQGTLSGFVRTSIINVSTYSTSGTNPCNPINTYGTGEGIELHIWEDTIDLSKSPFAAVLANTSCTELYIGASMCCRQGAITTGPANQDFHVYTVIYPRNIVKCTNQINNSPVFGRYYPQFLCCNTAQYLATGAMDTLDMDSLSFAVVPATSSIPNNSVTYNSPFSYQYPLTVKCGNPSVINCTPQPGTNPPSGFYLNAKTGDLIFTPVKCDEMAVMAIEVSEWRRDVNGAMQLIAKTRRDINLVMKDNCGFNNSPVISGIFAAKVIAGDKICLSFQLEDKPFTPYQTTTDSILVNWQGENPNPVWTLNRDTANDGKAKLEFCWQTKTSDFSAYAKKFNIQVSDNHDPKPQISTRTFEVLVQERDSAFINTAVQPCAGMKLTASLKKGKPSQATWKWDVFDTLSGKKVFSSLTQSAIVSYLPKGTYKAILTVDHQVYGYSPAIAFFSITADMPEVSMGTDVSVCQYKYHQISATSSAMKSPVTYRWILNGMEDSSITGNTYNLLISDTISVRLIAKDDDGCVASDTLVAIMYPRPALTWIKTPLSPVCANSPFVQLHKMFSQPDSTSLTKGWLVINGSLTKYGPNGLVDSLGNQKYILNTGRVNNALDLSNGKFVQENLLAWFTDSNGCTNNAQVSIRIHGYPVIELTTKEICQDRGDYPMDSLVLRPKTKFGMSQTWHVLSQPSGVDPANVLEDRSGGSGMNWWMNFGTPSEDFYAGTYMMRFRVKDQVTGCEASDTVLVTVNLDEILEATDYAICEGTESIDLVNILNINGNTPGIQDCNYKILSLNGDTSPSKWGTAYISQNKLAGNPGAGNWIIRCNYVGGVCPGSLDASLIVLPTPRTRFTTNPDSLTPVNSPFYTTNNSTAITGNGNINFVWYFDFPDSANTSTALAPQITYPSKDAKYRVRLVATSDKGCTSFYEKTLQVGNPASVRIIDAENMIMNARFQISGIAFSAIEICIYDASGRMVACKTDNDGIDLISGTYFYQIMLQNAGETGMIRGKKVIGE